MRLALVLPSQGVRMGGVQRFGVELADALDDHADVRRFRLHPQPGGSRSRALVAGIGAILREHRAERFDAVLSTFHWPPRLPGIPTYGVVHDLRALHGTSSTSVARVVQRAVTRSWGLAFVPTAHVGREVVENFGPVTTRVIGEGLDHLDRYASAHAAPRDRLVVLGGRAPHKRTMLGIRAALRAGQLLGVRPSVLGDIPEDLPGGVDRIADPTDAVVAATLASTRLVIAPTAYEGFGLAVGEALRSGAPVVYALDAPLGDLVREGGIGAAPTEEALADAAVQAWARAPALTTIAQDVVRDRTWAHTADLVMQALSAPVGQR